MNKPITIIGGGLAGLALGIGLRHQSVPVCIWEAGHYPRHRVCGEFVNGAGQDSLMRLGLSESLMAAGARVGESAAFYCCRARSRVRKLPKPALCLARFKLDTVLARTFEQAGGNLREGQPWQESTDREGMVRAAGRLYASDGERWFGLKAHARGVAMEADLEMHATLGGYVGLCRLAGDLVNVCGLFHQSRANRNSGASWRERLRGQKGSFLWQRLEQASFVEGSFCGISGVSLRPQRALARSDCCIGDALTMIPPVTGNGMSMAFEAAEMAIEPLVSYSRGEISWRRARELVSRRCDERFARRLAWGWVLQRLMLLGAVLPEQPVGLLLRWESLWRTMFARTR